MTADLWVGVDPQFVDGLAGGLRSETAPAAPGLGLRFARVDSVASSGALSLDDETLADWPTHMSAPATGTQVAILSYGGIQWCMGVRREVND